MGYYISQKGNKPLKDILKMTKDKDIFLSVIKDPLAIEVEHQSTSQ